MLFVNYMKSQCRWRKCQLEHPSPSNFYVSCWQNNRSAVYLLSLRTILFVFSTCVLLTSMITLPLTLNVHFGYWFIYVTHWGFLLIVLTTAFATSVSAYAYFKRPIDATFGLPWYVKVYWLLYNITIPVAFLITIFYWAVLKTEKSTVNYEPSLALEVMLHGGNSIVMFIELVCSAHPSRLMHVMQPLWFAGAYMFFSVIYFFAGGQDPWGNQFIYPVLDWSKPEQTMLVITLTALFLALLHLLVVAIASARDAIVKRTQLETAGIYNDAFTP